MTMPVTMLATRGIHQGMRLAITVKAMQSTKPNVWIPQLITRWVVTVFMARAWPNVRPEWRRANGAGNIN